jgi:DUF4097 and DUF4098 domain-containing protein YvlB
MRTKSNLFSLFLVFLLAVVFASPDVTSAAKVKKNVHKSFSLEMGGKVSVANTNGNIEIVSWDKETVDIQAEIVVKHNSRKRAEEYLELVEIHFDHNSDNVDIEVDHPNRNGSGVLSWLFGNGRPNASVNFQIKVPEKADLKIKTVNGAIEIEGVSGEMDTRSTNGGIRLTNIEGSVSSKSTNGGISVGLNKVGEFEKMSFSTTNGAIRISLPSDIRATLEASTVNGGVDTEFPIEVSGRFNSKKIRGDLNGGGGLIYLKTVNGGITIRESN